MLPWLGVSAHVSCVMNSIILECERVRGYLGEYEFVMDSWHHASVGALLCGHYVTLLFRY
jgi:hypothetical protein